MRELSFGSADPALDGPAMVEVAASGTVDAATPPPPTGAPAIVVIVVVMVVVVVLPPADDMEEDGPIPLPPVGGPTTGMA